MTKHTKEEKLEAFSRLLDILDRLRVECPWDKKQTNETLRINTIEEVHELSEALLKGEPEEIKKELGDLLLHVVFYARIGEEKGEYDIASISEALVDKLIYRHPHIFSTGVVAETEEAVKQNWEELKLKEKNGNKTVLSGVPKSLPSLVKAYRVQEKASGVGFDWKAPQDVWAKVREELSELEEASSLGDKEGLEAEFGDLLFVLINAARLYKINPDNALERTNQKFIRRFSYIESEAKKQGRELKQLSLEEMDHLWEEAKKQE